MAKERLALELGQIGAVGVTTVFAPGVTVHGVAGSTSIPKFTRSISAPELTAAPKLPHCLPLPGPGILAAWQTVGPEVSAEFWSISIIRGCAGL